MEVQEEVITASAASSQHAVRMRATSATGLCSEAEWMQKNVRKRVCTRYVKAKELPDFGPEITYTDLAEACQCGNAPEEHTLDVRLAAFQGSDETDAWNADLDTKEVVTDAYGEVDFIDSSKKIAKYVRIDERTDTEVVQQLLFDIWKLEHPTLVISIIGGVTMKHTKPKLLQAFRRGLLKVVRSGAWLITNGVRMGVMRIVGDASSSTIQDGSRTVCLGIVPWGAVANRDELITKHPCRSARYTISEQPQTRGLSLPLEPNHTHFLLVDNGTARLAGTEFVMRSKVEGLLANMSHGSHKVPLCCVVFSGGVPTFTVMHNSLQRGTPVVIVNGSGRMADLLSYVIAAFQEEETNDLNAPETSGVKKVGSLIGGVDAAMARWLKDEVDHLEEIPDLIVLIKSVVSEYYHLLHVFNKHNDARAEITETLDLTILRAILGVKNSADEEAQKINQLMLALQWNRCDIAQTEILTNDFQLRTETANELFTKALVQNKAQFVELLLDQGFNLREYLTMSKLVELYNQSGHSPFRTLVSKSLQLKRLARPADNQARSNLTIADIGRGISELCGGMYFSSYQHNPEKCDATYSVLFISEEDHIKFTKQAAAYDAAKSDPKKKRIARIVDNSLGDVALHLFLYAALMNRKEMAMIFWKDATHKIASAQMASFLLDKLVMYATDRDVRVLVEQNAAYFDDLAVGVLDACYSADQCHTHLLILRELREFAKGTCMDLSNISMNMPFISHTACQTLLNDIWHGEMRSNNSFLIFFCIFFPPMIPIAIKFHPSNPPKLITSIKQPTMQSDSAEDNGENAEIRPPPPIRDFKCPKSIMRIMQFYVSPRITFLSNMIMYVLFVTIFSFSVLHNHAEECETTYFVDVLLVIWVICLFAEELRQLIDEPGTATHKAIQYITNPWNQLDVLSISLFLIGQLISSVDTQTCYDNLTIIRIMMNTSLFIFYSRLLHCFSANEHIGPKLVMIFKMIKDIVIIMVIMIIINIGFSVVVISMTRMELSFDGLIDGFSKVYWAMFGDLPREDLQNEAKIPVCERLLDGSYNCTLEKDTIGGYYLMGFLSVFVILTNLLLFNVLIAMFNYTFNDVQDKSDQFWAYQRYKLITEYYTRPPFPPPILIFYHIWLLASFLYTKMVTLAAGDLELSFDSESECKVYCDGSVERQLVIWEGLVVDEYLELQEQTEKDSLNKQVDGLRDSVGTIKDAMGNVGTLIDMAEFNKTHLIKVDSVEQRVASLETKVDDMGSDIKELVKLLKVRK